MSKKTVSIAIPCYNEQDNIIPLYKELVDVTNNNKEYNYEFVFIDNGSSDQSKERIKRIIKKDKRVKGILLSRNFGPEASAQACHDYSSGNAVISIPCDSQDPPQSILKLIKKWEEGFNIVIGIYMKSEDDVLTRFMRKTFYKIFKLISNIDVPINASGFGLIDRKALTAIQTLPEKYRFFRGIRSWVGFKVGYIQYNRQKRLRGKSSYNFLDYVKHAERGVFGFSYVVLDLMVYSGFILVSFSFIFIFVYLILAVFFGNPIKGSISILVSIVFFGGIQLLAVSIVGKYVQVIVEETKNRPLYIVDEAINFEKLKSSK